MSPWRNDVTPALLTKQSIEPSWLRIVSTSGIARGRDASDVAISSTFGPNTLTSFKVWTDEVRAGLFSDGRCVCPVPVRVAVE